MPLTKYKCLTKNRIRQFFQVSMMANNINEQGFSFGDYANFSGAATGGGGQINVNTNNSTGVPLNTGRQNGIVTNYAGGINSNRNYNHDKTKLNSSYFYNRLDQNLI